MAREEGALAGSAELVCASKLRMADKSTVAHDFIQRGSEFLLVELQTGLTFADLALSAEPGSADRVRDERNARKAYQTVLRLRERFQVAAPAAREIEDLQERLRCALDQLAEKAG